MKRQTYFEVHKNKKPKIHKPVFWCDLTDFPIVVRMEKITKARIKYLDMKMADQLKYTAYEKRRHTFKRSRTKI